MNDAMICLEMGNAFQMEGDYPAAADAFRRATEIDPNLARAYYCRANLERELGKLAQSLENYNKALELDSTISDFYNNRGLLKYEIGDIAGSEADFLMAVKLQPEEGMFLNNLGVLYQCLNQLDQAQTAFEKATTVDPNYPSSYLNLGIVYESLGDKTKAIDYYDKAITLLPNSADAHNAKCLTLLLRGEYEEGWRMHEWRWHTKYKPFPDGAPEGILWTGKQSLDGKSILIQSEQGFGDTLQFCRYLPLIGKMGAKIIFRTEKRLIELMRSLPVEMQIIAMNESAPKTDYYFPLLSMPLAFNTTLKSIPRQFPYLIPDPQKCDYWKNRINQNHSDRLKVGLVWAGAPRPQKLSYRGLNSRRDIPLATLLPLLNENVQFFSLQKGESANSQLLKLEPSYHEKIIDWTDQLNSFADTAAFIANLDLVISVDTSIVHLAGAMGKTVLLLNRKDTCWRWLESGDHSPWYPSVAIFRQTQMLQWDEVIQNVILKVRELQASKIPS